MPFSQLKIIGFHNAHSLVALARSLCENQLKRAKMPYVSTSHEETSISFLQLNFYGIIRLWMSDSLSVFKFRLNNLLHPLIKYNRFLDFSLSRRASILHTRLRLGSRALDDYLFSVNCAVSSICV